MGQEYLPGDTPQQRLQDLMKEYKITQAELASKIGVAESSISRFLNGTKNKLTMFSELTKGQDLHHPSVSPEQLAAMVVQPISQMGLAEDESLAELQQALLHMMESMQPKQSDENDDQ